MASPGAAVRTKWWTDDITALAILGLVWRARGSLIAVCALAACSPPATSPAADAATAPSVDARVQLDGAMTWPQRRSLDADLDGDGAAERVVLAADVMIDAQRGPLWEDGHRWALIVEDARERTLAYGAFVPNGHVEAAVLTAAAGSNRRHLLVRERTPQQSRTIVLGYDGPGKVRIVSAAVDQVEQWVPDLRGLATPARECGFPRDFAAALGGERFRAGLAAAQAAQASERGRVRVLSARRQRDRFGRCVALRAGMLGLALVDDFILPVADRAAPMDDRRGELVPVRLGGGN